MGTITGGPGNDILNGLDGQDNLIYGDTSDTLAGATGGNDTITGGANGTNTIYGDAATLMGHDGLGGNDTLIGGTNSINTLVGDANDFVGPATGGNDTLIGGVGGANTLIGDGINTMGPATGGDDRLVSADNTTDNMWGDFQFGGGPGNVTGGHDTFVFDQHNGNDVINDFQQGIDTIELDGFFKGNGAGHHPDLPPQAAAHVPPQALESFTDLNITEANGNSVIHFDANDSVTVVGVTGLTAADFHFVA